MGIRKDVRTMTLSADEIVQLSKRYTLYDWSAQSKVAPMAVDRAEGVYFYGVDGTRYLDFNSQLMGVNIGHGNKRVIDAIAKQGETLAYITPFVILRSWRGRLHTTRVSVAVTLTYAL